MAVFSFNQSNVTAASTTGGFTGANTAGNLIIALNFAANTVVGTAISDTQGNTYFQAGQFNISGIGKGVCWIATNIAAGTNTATFSGDSATNNDIIVMEYNTPANYILDASNNVTIPTAFLPSYTATYPLSAHARVGTNSTLPSEVLLFAAGYFNVVGTTTFGNGTIRNQGTNGGGGVYFAGDFDVVSPVGVVTIPMTCNVSGAVNPQYPPTTFVIALQIPPSSGGGSGGVILGDMSGGMRG